MKTLLSFLALSILLTACAPTETPVEPIDESDSAVFTWMEYGMSLEVPEGLVVTELSSGDGLILDTMDLTGFEGDFMGQVSIHAYEETLEDYVQSVKDRQSEAAAERPFEQEVVSIGDKSFTEITWYSEFSDHMVTNYLIEENGTTFVIAEGLDGNKAYTETVLETLEF